MTFWVALAAFFSFMPWSLWHGSLFEQRGRLWAWLKGTKNPWVWKRVLQRPGRYPYMVRRQLLVTRWLTIYLNNILTPDFDARLHTHPWKRAYSLKLAGYYYEELSLILGGTIRRPGRWSRIPKQHRIVSLSEAPVWTLFIGIGKPVPWGFINPDGTLEPGPSAQARKL